MKYNINFKWLIVLFFTISYLQSIAQGGGPILVDSTTMNLDYNTAVNLIFDKLDKSKLKTGLLKERTHTFLDWDQYLAPNPSAPCDKDKILELYSELYYAKFSHDPTEKEVTVIEREANDFFKNTGKIPLMLVDFEYDYFHPNAFANGFLVTAGMEVKENGSPTSADLYQQNRVFAMAPLINKVYNTQNVSFILTNDFILSNNNDKITNVEVDFGDGEGWRNITVGEPITIHLPENNSLDMHFRVDKGQVEFESQAKMGDTNTNMSLLSTTTAGDPPNDTVNFSLPGSSLVHQFGIWFGCDKDLAAPCLRKPLVLVDGFDPTDSRRITDIDLTDEKYLFNVVNQQDMANKLREAGYDLIILNYDHEDGGLLPIQEKAKVVEELTRRIMQLQAQCGSNHEIVWIGPSEGALVVRFALAEMEQNAEDHHTRLFISFDGPNQGANLPLSLQFYLDMLHDAIPPLHVAGLLSKGVNALPTKQMLRFHHLDFPNNAPEFDQFQTEMHQLNGGAGYPTKCHKVVISNGSALAENQGFNANDKLFAYNLTLPILNSLGLSSVYADGFALPDGGSPVKIFSGTAWKIIHPCGIPLLCPPITFPFIIRLKKAGNTPPMDNAPGGKTDFTHLVGDQFEDALSQIGASFLFNANFPANTDFQNFIPLTSALDLQNNNNMFFHAKNSMSMLSATNGGFEQFNLGNSVTPFDGVYVEEHNDFHVINGVTPGIATFVENEIMPVDLKLQNRTITNYTADFEGTHTVEIGENVNNPRYASGKFIADVGAKLRINAGNHISLKPGFVGKNGSIVKFELEKLSVNCDARRLANPQTHSNDTETTNHNHVASGLDNKTGLLCYPNPFTESTNITYNLQKEGNVSIKVVSLLGNTVVEKSQGMQSAGSYKSDLQMPGLESGLYFLILTQDGKVLETAKIQVLK